VTSFSSKVGAGIGGAASAAKGAEAAAADRATIVAAGDAALTSEGGWSRPTGLGQHSSHKSNEQ